VVLLYHLIEEKQINSLDGDVWFTLPTNSAFIAASTPCRLKYASVSYLHHALVFAHDHLIAVITTTLLSLVALNIYLNIKRRSIQDQQVRLVS